MTGSGGGNPGAGAIAAADASRAPVTIQPSLLLPYAAALII